MVFVRCHILETGDKDLLKKKKYSFVCMCTPMYGFILFISPPARFCRWTIPAHSPLQFLWPAVWDPQSPVMPRPRPSAPARPYLVNQNVPDWSPQRGHDTRWWRQGSVRAHQVIRQSLVDPARFQKVPRQPPAGRAVRQPLHGTSGLFHEGETLIRKERGLAHR